MDTRKVKFEWRHFSVFFVLFLFGIVFTSCNVKTQRKDQTRTKTAEIKVGAQDFDSYLSLLEGKNVGILTNQTAVVDDTHIIDTLISLGVNITKIFGPEHGFRSDADAGAKIDDQVDPKTGIPVISLWGDHFKPTSKDLSDIDIVIYDIQDVGTRFYTYISSMQYLMEAAADNNVKMIILDRPNPNGFYIDGPLLKDDFHSLVGEQPVPIVYGMTIGEYAKMIVGEKGLNSENKNLDLSIIECANYTHDSLYRLPVPPSPNLPNMTSVYLYPSLCFFEGTAISEGRGTQYPFQLYGSPTFSDTLYSFTPKSVPGASDPKNKGELSYGVLVAETAAEALEKTKGSIRLKWIIDAYKRFPEKDKFFTRVQHFDDLAGSDDLRKMIISGFSEEEIRKGWEDDLEKFKKIREKYLLYPDFTD